MATNDWSKLTAEVRLEAMREMLESKGFRLAHRKDVVAEIDPALKELAVLRAENGRLQAHVDDLQSGMYINCVYCGHRY